MRWIPFWVWMQRSTCEWYHKVIPFMPYTFGVKINFVIMNKFQPIRKYPGTNIVTNFSKAWLNHAEIIQSDWLKIFPWLLSTNQIALLAYHNYAMFIFVLKMTNPAHFLYIFILFKHTLGFSGIRTRIVGVEGEPADHLTTTTPLLKICYWPPHSFLPVAVNVRRVEPRRQRSRFCVS